MIATRSTMLLTTASVTAALSNTTMISPVSTDWLTVLLTVVQILMGIVLTFGMFILSGLRDDLRTMGEGFAALQREVLKDAMPKHDFETYRAEQRQMVQDLREDVIEANMKAAIVAAKVGVEFPRSR